ncbi:MAG: hypothetical protein AAGA85_07615 [Bacteroidota bacterium]
MNKDEVELLVAQFEAGTYPAASWTHTSHVVMGLWYLFHFPVGEACRKIKQGIRDYNVSQGGINSETEGYHETITELYIQTLVRYLSRLEALEFDEVLSSLKDEPFMDKAFPFQFYSQKRLMSTEARREWIEPDLQPVSMC